MNIHFDDLTAINVPLAMLDDDTRERLIAHGGPWQMWIPASARFDDIDNPGWMNGFIYRVKVLVTLYWGHPRAETATPWRGHDTHRITFDPIALTATVEKL